MNAFIIEDDIFWRNKIQMMASEIGIAVIGEADNIDDSRRFLGAKKPDLIISDILLDDELAFELFADGKFSDIPVLFLTQSEDPENYTRARHVKYSNFLMKPFHALTLQAAIDILMKPFESHLFSHPKTIAVRGKNNEKVNLPIQEIIYVQQQRNYCHIETAHQSFAVKTSLVNMAKELNTDFIQINKSCIVNKYFIVQLTAIKYSLRIGKTDIPIGRKFRNDILQYVSAQHKF